jgi:NADH-quinone oxidoreductase subunit G
MANALSDKRPDLGGAAPEPEEMKAIRELAQLVSGVQNLVIIYGSEGTDLEASQTLAQACANLLIATGHTGRANNGLIPAWQVGNVQGAWDMGLRPVPSLAAAMQAAKALYLVAADPADDDPELAEAVKAAEFVVVQDLFMTPTAMMADVVLPAMSFAEREGSYTNGLRRVQRFYPAITARPNTQPDFAITGQIAKRLGLDLESDFPNLVMRRIAAQIPDYSAISYRKLAEVTEQWPIIGREDVYYGGTGYDNHQGLGIPLSSAAQRGEPVSLGWMQPLPLDGKPPAEAELNPGLLGMPVTRLYDRGQTVLPSLLLRTRVPEPFVVLNPQDAGRLELKAGNLAEVTLRGQTLTVIVRVDDTVPVGILLLPRSMGLPVTGPEIVQIRVAEANKELAH